MRFDCEVQVNGLGDSNSYLRRPPRGTSPPSPKALPPFRLCPSPPRSGGAGGVVVAVRLSGPAGGRRRAWAGWVRGAFGAVLPSGLLSPRSFPSCAYGKSRTSNGSCLPNALRLGDQYLALPRFWILRHVRSYSIGIKEAAETVLFRLCGHRDEFGSGSKATVAIRGGEAPLGAHAQLARR
jgi:hypothetical protein